MAKNKSNLNVRTVSLHSGGQVTVSLDGNVFDLSGTDREFVNRLVEMIQSYEAPDQQPDQVGEESIGLDVEEGAS